MKEKILKLTNTVYKVLEFFPESDPLKNRAKDRALAIMENLILVNETSGWASFSKEKIKVQILEDVDILLGYLWIGKTQQWLNPVNCLIITNEYEKIKKELGSVIELTKKLPGIEQIAPQEATQTSVAPVIAPVLEEPEVDLPEPHPSSSSARQEKILDFLKSNEKAQVMDLQKVLPDITKRTIRRDLDELLELGKIVRMGDFNQVFYKMSLPGDLPWVSNNGLVG